MLANMVALGSVLGLVLPVILWADRSAGVGFRFASHISDYMVLQKEPAGAVIWGYGIPGATVTVSLASSQKTIMKKVTQVKAQSSNTWLVVLDPMKPGGPFEVLAQQTVGSMNSTLRVHSVLFGDVWLCSGQSNMEMTVSQIFNATKELSNVAAYESVRIMSVSLVEAEEELEDLPEVDLPWSTPTSGNLGHGNFTYMSAVCWLYGRYLYDALQYPVGLISSVWGGTPIEAWSSARVLKACDVPKKGYVPPDTVSGPAEHSVLWNAMVHPLCNMTLKGVIWYQGESNMNYNKDLYNCTFPELIEDWRHSFHQGSQGQTERFFPFGFVQILAHGLRKAVEDGPSALSPATHMEDLETWMKLLAFGLSYHSSGHCDNLGSKPLSSYLPVPSPDEGFPDIRWHQTADLGYVPNVKMPNTFMAVSIDLGDRNSPYGSVHPRDKQTVAYRLHLGARAMVYGEKDLIFQGPLPEKIEFLAHQELINLTYYQQIQLQRQDNNIFQISCCSNRQCKWLPAPMSKFSNWTLTLNMKSCGGAVVALRYAWATWPCEYKQCPIYHPESALPAPPFMAFVNGHRGKVARG